VVAIIAMTLPHRRHRDGIKPGKIKAFGIKIVLQVVDTFIIAEFPVAVQQKKPVRIFPVQDQRTHGPAGGDIIGPVGLCVQVKHRHIFKIIWQTHRKTPSFILCISIITPEWGNGMNKITGYMHKIRVDKPSGQWHDCSKTGEGLRCM
jgi:hypothetical protein